MKYAVLALLVFIPMATSQQKAQQSFTPPSWANLPISSVTVYGGQVRIQAWTLFVDNFPISQDQRNVAVQSNGMINGVYYPIPGIGTFPSEAAAQVWVQANIPPTAPYTNWKWVASVGVMVP